MDKLSDMRIQRKNEADGKMRPSTIPRDQVDSLFRYVANLEGRLEKLERKERNHSALLGKFVARFNILRRRFDGFPALTPKQKARAERRREVKRLLEKRQFDTERIRSDLADRDENMEQGRHPDFKMAEVEIGRDPFPCFHNEEGEIRLDSEEVERI